jgi:hypothetical protein
MMKRICILTFTLMSFFIYTFAEAATLTTQIARTREYLYQSDSANSTYTDAQITEAINQGQELLSNLLSYSANWENISYALYASSKTSEAYFSIPTSTTAVGLKKIISAFITWPTDAFSVKRPMIQVKPEEFPYRFYQGSTKDPTFFMGDGLFRYCPAHPGGGYVWVSILYLKKYTTLSSGSETVTVQDRYLNLLTLCSVWYILQADNQQARAANIYKLLTDLVTIENNALVNTNVIERVQGGK